MKTIKIVTLSISDNECTGLDRTSLEKLEMREFNSTEQAVNELLKHIPHKEIRDKTKPESIKINFYDLIEFNDVVNYKDIDILDHWITSIYIDSPMTALSI